MFVYVFSSGHAENTSAVVNVGTLSWAQQGWCETKIYLVEINQFPYVIEYFSPSKNSDLLGSNELFLIVIHPSMLEE